MNLLQELIYLGAVLRPVVKHMVSLSACIYQVLKVRSSLIDIAFYGFIDKLKIISVSEHHNHMLVHIVTKDFLKILEGVSLLFSVMPHINRRRSA